MVNRQIARQPGLSIFSTQHFLESDSIAIENVMWQSSGAAKGAWSPS